MRRKPTILEVAKRTLACLVLTAQPAVAQNILELPGKTVEVIGLRHWTIPMMQDSLARYAPDARLDTHGCAAALRHKLGFPDAAVLAYRTSASDPVERLVVMVVEPGDASRVQRTSAAGGSLALPAEWDQAIELLASAPGAVQVAAQSYPTRRRDPTAVQLPPWAKRDSLQVAAYWAFLDARDSGADYRLALDALVSSSEYRHRIVAVTVLAGFGDRDEAVHGLVRVLRDEHDHVANTAASVLRAIAGAGRLDVEWQPAAEDIHAVLNGTALYTLPTLLRVLVTMEANPRYAAAFLEGGGEAVLDNLAAQHPEHRTAAHRLLVQLRGEDLGSDVAVWRAWISDL